MNGTDNLKKYIKDGIVWGGYCWLRCSDLTLYYDTFRQRYRYIPACNPRVTYGTAYPYEEWMEKYLGTDNKELNKIIVCKLQDMT